jgi:hypothetical protein
MRYVAITVAVYKSKLISGLFFSSHSALSNNTILLVVRCSWPDARLRI